MPYLRQDAEREKGFALVLVLWTLLLLAFLSNSLLQEVRATRTVASSAAARLKARAVADAAINRVILSLLDPRDPQRWPLDGTTGIIRLFNRDVLARVESEAGKIDLNAASPKLLAALFRSQGAAPDAAETLADHIQAWRSPPPLSGTLSNSEELGAYQADGRAYSPSRSPFRVVGELRLVLGMTDALQSAVSPLVTVWSGEPNVDRGTAVDRVLVVLAAAGDDFALGQQNARAAGHAAGGDRTPAAGEAVTIVTRVESDDMAVERRAVIRLAGGRYAPYRVLAWQ